MGAAFLSAWALTCIAKLLGGGFWAALLCHRVELEGPWRLQGSKHGLAPALAGRRTASSLGAATGHGAATTMGPASTASSRWLLPMALLARERTQRPRHHLRLVRHNITALAVAAHCGHCPGRASHCCSWALVRTIAARQRAELE